MTTVMSTPDEISKQIANSVQTKRLSLNYTQKTLSARSGVSLGVIKKFEHTGKISLESLLKLALVLGCLEDFKNLFNETNQRQIKSLDEILKSKSRKRGRQ